MDDLEYKTFSGIYSNENDIKEEIEEYSKREDITIVNTTYNISRINDEKVFITASVLFKPIVTSIKGIERLIEEIGNLPDDHNDNE